MQPSTLEQLYIRQISNSDVDKLKEWSGEILIPNINDPLVVVSGSCFDERDILCGAGFVRLVGEATITLNPSLTRQVKGEVLRELFAAGRMLSYKEGLDKLIAFTDNPLYARLLKKRFNFSDASGIGLQLEL